MAWDIAQTFPKVLRVIWLLKKYPDLPSLLQVVTPQQINASKTTPSTERLVRGVGWSTRLLRFRPEGTCLLRSLTLFSELRSRGQKAFFVSGVRKDPGGIKGHAWVELDGKALKGFGDENARELYKISIIHPQST